jgi:sialate O-acetylesterase
VNLGPFLISIVLKSRWSVLTLWLFSLACAPFAVADPVLPNLISDHMVLQQGREIHIWGKADSAETITVSLAGNTRTTYADSSGHWSVHFAPMVSGGPFILKVAGKKTILIKDVMIGEVWIASGQSNMAFALSGSVGASEEIPKADYPNLRLFTVPKKEALDPQPDSLPAQWQPCTPDTAKEFSAVAYYFARDLHRQLNVPIGIITSAWPGSTIEEWIAPEQAQRDPQIKPMLDEWNRSEGKDFAAGRSPFDLAFDDFELVPNPSSPGKPLQISSFDDGSARNSLGGDWAYDWSDAPETTFDLVSPGHGGAGFAARVAGRIDASDDSRLTARFHLDGTPVDLSTYAGIRFWVRGSGSFRFRSLQPTITDWDDYSSSLLQASADWTPVTIWFRDLRQEGWGVSTDFTPSALKGFVIENMSAAGYPPRLASGLYQGMIAPLLQYPFRGAIWYQGESNALKAQQYRVLLPDLIKSWRSASHNSEMQFLIVQLPAHGAIPTSPTESDWAELREAQLFALKEVPGTGLAVTIDVGDPKDVHPHRKAEVGQRLALWALGSTYQKPIVYSGPLYESMAVDDGKIRIRFSHIGSALEAKVGAALRGFAIAGPDQKFYWAEAVIDGDSIIVSSPHVSSPLAVRYAWGDSPECNLFNTGGLPASPFRTDEWPRVTKK